jgi:riboflavin synthase
MFTGLISHLGTFRGYRKGRRALLVGAPGLAPRLAVGESLAVDGVCLSVVATDRDDVLFDLSRESAERTTLGGLLPGASLNLERPLTPSSPISGHLVSGHVDGVGRVLKVASRPPGKRVSVSLPAGLRPFLVPKGSIAVAGVSLTIASLGSSSFEIELIPLTLEGTNLGRLRAGTKVNLECDMVGKYVYNYLSRGYEKG